MPEPGPRYWAFLSYSHADVGCAQWLHRALERYVLPRRLVGLPTPAGAAPRRLRPIFRDREELGAAPDLGGRLVEALGASACLIVICSPDAARSVWVEQEIRQFKTLHGEDRVLAVIAAGKPFASDIAGEADQECFPEALRTRLDGDEIAGRPRTEPAAADLRPGKDGRRRALLKLVAGMLQIDLDEIVHRDAQRDRQQLLGLTAAALTASAAMAALALAAVAGRNEAIAQRAQAEGLIEFMIGDLRKTLEPAGRLDALDAIGGRALSYYAGQDSRELDAASLGRRARVLQMLGLVREERGDLRTASQFYAEAAKSTGELLARQPDDPQRIFDHAQSVFYIGEVAMQRGDFALAQREFEAYRGLADRLVRIDPNNRSWWAEVDEANTSLGAVLLRNGQGDAAAADFARALAISRNLAIADPASRDRQWDLAQIYAWAADAEVAGGRLDTALADRTAEGAIYARLIQASPSDAQAAVAMAASRRALASIRLQSGAAAQAVADLQASVAEMDQLMAAAPDNAVYRANAQPSFLLLAEALLQSGQLPAASAAAQRALAMSEREAQADGGLAWQGARLGGARVLSLRIAAAAAVTPQAQRAALEGASAEAARLAALVAASPANVALARVAAEAALLAGDEASLSGDASGARSWWNAADTVLRRALPAQLPASDPSQPLLRQLAFRLSLLRPPLGPLPANPGVTAQTVPAGSRNLVDYRW